MNACNASLNVLVWYVDYGIGLQMEFLHRGVGV